MNLESIRTLYNRFCSVYAIIVDISQRFSHNIGKGCTSNRLFDELFQAGKVHILNSNLAMQNTSIIV